MCYLLSIDTELYVIYKNTHTGGIFNFLIIGMHYFKSLETKARTLESH